MTHFSFVSFVLSLAAAAALLIWSVRLVRTGVERAFGRHLRQWMKRSSESRLMAAGSGVFAALTLQSATAVLALVAGFSGAQAFSATAGLSVLLGADLGSALVVKLMTLNTSALMPLFLLAGVVLFLRGATGEIRQSGRILIGLALIFVSLQMIRDAAAPLVGQTGVHSALHALGADPLSAFLVGALLAWAVHSSVATVLLVVTMSSQGLLPIFGAEVIVLGANFGSCMIAFGLTMRGTETARSIVFGNLALRGGGAVLVLALLASDVLPPDLLGADPAHAALNLHVAFNALILLLSLPMVTPVTHLSARAVAVLNSDAEKLHSHVLDAEQFENHPKRALARASRDLVQIGQMVEAMHAEGVPLLFQWQSSRATAIIDKASEVRERHTAFKLFIAAVQSAQSSNKHDDRFAELIMIGANIEAASSVIAGDLLDIARGISSEGLQFSVDGEKDIRDLSHFVLANIEAALSLLTERNLGAAQALLERKDRLREQERQLQNRHLDRLAQGGIESISTSSQHQETLRCIKQVNSCFAVVASSLLERSGKLSDTRLITG